MFAIDCDLQVKETSLNNVVTDLVVTAAEILHEYMWMCVVGVRRGRMIAGEERLERARSH